MRITIDLDGYRGGIALAAERAWAALGQWADRREIYLSSSGRGLHLVGHGVEASDALDARRVLGDDPRRIDMDEMRGRHGMVTDVLWTSKGDGEVERMPSIAEALHRLRMEGVAK